MNIENTIFQQDLAPCHASKKVKNFVVQNGIQCLDCPGHSPDLNPIENLCAIVKNRMRKIDCITKEKMICAVIQVWFHNSKISEICKNLVDSMPKRVKKVIIIFCKITSENKMFLLVHINLHKGVYRVIQNKRAKIKQDIGDAPLNNLR